NSTNKTLLASIASSTRALFSSVNATATLSSLAVAPFIATNYTARDMCYTYIASKTSNASICARTGSYASALCTYSVSGNYSSAPPTYPQLLANCNQLSSYKSECVQYVKLAQAIATRNASICASFPTNFGWQCYSAIAAKYNNATFCGYIANSTANNSCLAQLK
ncbi:MAG: hypothetical protein KGH71_06200, partial [Candidatus Micrarchaeota archaeon]|nr:hypothetical protein [Candidatus Micrarchaeota archaeon]